MNQRELSAFNAVLRQSVQAALQAGIQLGSGQPAVPQSTSVVPAPQPAPGNRKRKTRNGVTEPHSVGKLRAVWDICDHLKAQGVPLEVDTVRQHAAAQDIPASTAQIQFYAWRKFHARASSRMH